MFQTRRWFVVCTMLAACGQIKPAEKPRAAAPSPAQANVARAQVQPLGEPDRTPLGQRLLREASEHPEAVAEVEDRLEAFAAAGVTITRTRQVLASTLNAHYCKTALTSAGLALALCAFESEPDAQAGRARSRARFDTLIPGRSLLVHRATLLTVTQPASVEAQRDSELLQNRFTQPASAERAAL